MHAQDCAIKKVWRQLTENTSTAIKQNNAATRKVRLKPFLRSCSFAQHY